MSLYRYRQLEGGDQKERINLSRLQDSERCFIARRRSGLRITDLVEKAGLSTVSIVRIEKGTAPARRLIEFWSAA